MIEVTTLVKSRLKLLYPELTELLDLVLIQTWDDRIESIRAELNKLIDTELVRIGATPTYQVEDKVQHSYPTPSKHVPTLVSLWLLEIGATL